MSRRSSRWCRSAICSSGWASSKVGLPARVPCARSRRSGGGGGGEFKSTTPGTNLGPREGARTTASKAASESQAQTIEAAPPPRESDAGIDHRQRPVRCRCSRAVRCRRSRSRGVGVADLQDQLELTLAATRPGRRGPQAEADHAEQPRRGAGDVGEGDRLPRDPAQDLAARLLRVRARRSRGRATELELGFATDVAEPMGRREPGREAKRRRAQGRPRRARPDRSRSRSGCSTTRSPTPRPHARSSSRPARARSAERSKRETEAREHPITKHVLQTFGASIKEIKTDV